MSVFDFRRSIRFRLTVWYSVVLSVGLLLFSALIWLTLRHQLHADLDSKLLNQARGFDEYLHLEDHHKSMRLGIEIDEYSRSMPVDHVLAVFAPDGHAVFADGIPADSPLLMKQLQQADSAHIHRLHWQNHKYRVITRPLHLTAGQFLYILAIPEDATEDVLERLFALLLSLAPGFIACAAAGGYWLSRRALAPVDQITARARSIGISNLSERLPIVASRDEIQRLSETWNEMLARLERAVSKISQFTADASHELRTPVAIIRFTAERVLRKTRSESEYRDALHQIQSESESMSRLIEDLLFLARADVQSDLTYHEAVDIAALLATTCSEIQPLASAKQIALNCRVSSPSFVYGNPSALRRLLLILLDNALKYTPAGGSIEVAAEHENDHVVVSVTDTGVGIEEDLRSRIFERFFRVDSSRNKQSGGYGLGLSIAKTIAEQHQAEINLRPGPAGGTTFSVILPMAA